jgi:predicted nucleic acid-binding protein
MIILDSNVVLEPTRPKGDPAVAAWLDKQVAETLYLTATSLSELLGGFGFFRRVRGRRAWKQR